MAVDEQPPVLETTTTTTAVLTMAPMSLVTFDMDNTGDDDFSLALILKLHETASKAIAEQQRQNDNAVSYIIMMLFLQPYTDPPPFYAIETGGCV